MSLYIYIYVYIFIHCTNKATTMFLYKIINKYDYSIMYLLIAIMKDSVTESKTKSWLVNKNGSPKGPYMSYILFSYAWNVFSTTSSFK